MSFNLKKKHFIFNIFSKKFINISLILFSNKNYIFKHFLILATKNIGERVLIRPFVRFSTPRQIGRYFQKCIGLPTNSMPMVGHHFAHRIYDFYLAVQVIKLKIYNKKTLIKLILQVKFFLFKGIFSFF